MRTFTIKEFRDLWLQCYGEDLKIKYSGFYNRLKKAKKPIKYVHYNPPIKLFLKLLTEPETSLKLLSSLNLKTVFSFPSLIK